MNDSPSPQADFNKSEYDGLRREIELKLNEASALERYAVLGTSGVWAWLATHATSKAYQWFWFIPVVLTLLSFYRFRALEKEFGLFAEYLESLESRLKTEGWQTFLVKSENKTRRNSISTSSEVFWITLLVATILVGAYGARHSYTPQKTESTTPACK
jgi:hypothetical protein